MPPRPTLTDRLYLRELLTLMVIVGISGVGWVLWAGSEPQPPAQAAPDPGVRVSSPAPAAEWEWRGSRLLPEPSSDTRYYVTRCAPSQRVRIRGPHSFSPSSPRELTPGQSVSFSSGGARYHVRCLPADFPQWGFTRRGSEDEIPWKFWAASPAMSESTDFAVIWNRDGIPVWWLRAPTPSYDTKLTASPQIAAGEPVVAWSTSFSQPFGLTSDMAHPIHALDGRLIRSNRGVGAPSDHHDIQLTPRGTELIVSYYPRATTADLRELDLGEVEHVIDGAIQELDSDGELVWIWNSKDHIAVEESHPHKDSVADPTTYPDGIERHDLTHLNSIAILPGDRLLLSFRRLDAAYLISYPEGDVIWKLSGVPTERSLQILDESGIPLQDSEAQQIIAQQHDARAYPADSPAARSLGWDGRGEIVSVFDNSTGLERAPRGILFGIDERARTAQVLQTVTDPLSGASGCCGSARWDPQTGAWAVAWGGNGLSSGFDAEGEITWRLDLGDSKSYRLNPVSAAEPGGDVSARELWEGMERMRPQLKR